MNLSALQQAIGYDNFYRRSNQLTEKEIHTFLLSSRQPNGRFLERYGYQTGKWAGVYYSQNPILSRLPLLSLNALSDAEHNAFVKCFASRKAEKQRAFTVLQAEKLSSYSPGIYWFIFNLWRHWFKPKKGEDDMNIQLSQEDFRDMYEMWGDRLIDIIPREKILAHFTLEERLAGLEPEERLVGLEPEERLVGLEPEEWLVGLTPADLEKIEAYLQQQKQQRDNDQSIDAED